MTKIFATKLEEWMDRKGENDFTLAERLQISRAHVSRLRRGVYGASKATALKIEAVTGIPWHTFIEPAVRRPAKSARALA